MMARAWASLKTIKRLAYIPFSLASSLVGSFVGRRLFRAVWGRILTSRSPAPPGAPDVSLAWVALSAALEAATLAAAVAVARQLAARLFHDLFGAWPSRPRAAAPGPKR